MRTKTSLQETITKADLLELKNDLRGDLKKELVKTFTNFETKIDAKLAIRFAEFEIKMDDKIKECKNEILTRFDSWAKALETAHEDQVISTSKISSHALILKDHGKRIKKLEKMVN